MIELSHLWAAFWFNTIAAIAVARAADLAFTRASRMACGGAAIALALFAVAILLRCVEATLR